MASLSRKELLRLQKGEKKSETKNPVKQIELKPDNKYLNIVKGDINTLITMLTGGIRDYFRKKQERQDFMEHHFPGMKE